MLPYPLSYFPGGLIKCYRPFNINLIYLLEIVLLVDDLYNRLTILIIIALTRGISRGVSRI